MKGETYYNWEKNNSMHPCWISIAKETYVSVSGLLNTTLGGRIGKGATLHAIYNTSEWVELKS